METPSRPGKSSADGDVSALLRAWSGGDQNAIQALTPIVYDELHRLARHYMRRERPEHSLQAGGGSEEAETDLVALDEALIALGRIDPRRCRSSRCDSSAG